MKQLTEEQIKIDKIKDLLWKQTQNHPLGMPYYYAVLYYCKSFTGDLLDTDDYRKRWDRGEVIKTHTFVSKNIRKCFGENVPLWWTIERHKDVTDEDGTIKKGAFHSNLYIGSIADDAIENPSPSLMPLFYKEDECGIPINMRPADLEQLKILLLNACIRQSKWVGKHPNALNLSAVPADEMERTFHHYGLKTLNSNLDGLNYIIDWGNSSFYKPN
jgi:hypothetical protein